ncbi:MAG TPA: peptidoglycan editing factor PgeF [Rhizobacter sp.]
MPMHPDWLRPAWGLPGVQALMTTRAGGGSVAPWDSMNLGTAVGDDPDEVARNRALLQQAIDAEPVFLKQVHGTRVVRLARGDVRPPVIEADACMTTEPGLACVVQVADCLPVLMAAPGGVAAAHAGWRGLAGGVVEAALHALCEATGARPAEVECWLGACIGPQAFEVGADVLEGFGVQPAGADPSRFRPLRAGKWLANLPQLARDRLAAAGVERVSGGEWCTVHDGAAGRSRFFSFRRDGVTGRMAAVIWRH